MVAKQRRARETKKKSARSLAAIMFTDMVGFTALNQANEARALEILERHNRLLRPFFPKFGGREVKTIGDSFLVEFPSALDATLCATEIQKFLHDYNVSATDDWKIKLRIGIHLGDVVRKGKDIFGDSVNIASRIRPLAEPEGICVSQQVFDQVHNKIEGPMVQLEETSLKNVSFPIGVFSVVMPWEDAALKIPRVEQAGPRLDPKRVAVLPFSNMSPDPGDEYFADGITEELISTVSKLSGLQVIARTSVLRYKGGVKGIGDIGKELQVGTVLEGSVRKAGDRVRITAQLIDSRNEAHLWAQNYDRKLEDIFSLQSEIAEKIADSLKIRLVEKERDDLAAGSTKSAEAYDKYLLAKKIDVNADHRSKIRYLEEAIRADPNFALAYADLAHAYVLVSGDILPAKEAFSKAELYLSRALELDDRLPNAWLAKGNLSLQHDWDYAAAKECFEKAIELNPSYSNAYAWLAVVMVMTGNFERAIELSKKATETDPVPIFPRGILCCHYALAGRYDEAIREFNRLLVMHPNEAETHNTLAQTYFQIGRDADARRELDELQKILSQAGEKRSWSGGGVVPWLYALNSFVYVATGNSASVEKILRKAEEEQRAGGHVPKSDIGIFCLALGNKERAFELFEAEVEEGSPGLLFVYMWRGFDSIRTDPRFITLLRRMKLTEVAEKLERSAMH